MKEFVFKELTKNDLIDIYYGVEIQEIENKSQDVVKLKTNKGIFESCLLVGADG